MEGGDERGVLAVLGDEGSGMEEGGKVEKGVWVD